MWQAWRVVAAAAILELATSCIPTTGSGPSASRTASPSPFTGSAVDRIGERASLGWDGVEKRVMLVASLKDAHTQLTHIGAWLLTTSGWKPTMAPDVSADEQGFASLNLAYDSDRKLELLVSSTASQPGTAVVSEWNGSSWRNVALSGAPAWLESGTYSPDLHALVAVQETNRQSLMWMYDGASWRTLATGAPNQIQTMAYDPGRHSILALGAFDFKTYVFDGTSWTAISGTPPVPDRMAAVTFDSQHGRWVAFGGVVDMQSLRSTSTTWIGNGRSWTNVSPSTVATPRSSGHMAWDPQRQRAVLFGGVYQIGLDYSDTWEWTGTSWTKVLDAAPLADAAHLPAPETCVASASYGLVIASGRLQIVDTCGAIKISAPIGPSSVNTCTAGGNSAVIMPPVSASDDKVFYRDGDTRVRSVSLDGTTADVTTVPGGPNTVSMFSVSPDDRRIAVVVEDLTPSHDINLRIYVEDLLGGGHRADIYSTTISKATGDTLWPMGWHGGLIVLGVMKACSPDPSSVQPAEWHLSDPATGDRRVTVTGPGCLMGDWPSPAGAICAGSGRVNLYQWTSSGGPALEWPYQQAQWQSGLSTAGHQYFLVWNSYGQLVTYVFSGPRLWTTSKLPCLWIDEDHMLAPDAVISMPSPKFPYSQWLPVYPLPASGTCVGRFPGGL